MCIALRQSRSSPRLSGMVEVRLLAPGELCCLTHPCLTEPLRYPYIRHAHSPVSSDLLAHTTGGLPWECQGFQFQPSSTVIACRWPYSGFSIGAHTLCYPILVGLPHQRKGSTRSRAYSSRFIPYHGSPSNSCHVLIYEAAPFALCYGLRFRPAPLTGSNSRFIQLSTFYGGIEPD